MSLIGSNAPVIVGAPYSPLQPPLTDTGDHMLGLKQATK